MKPMRRILLLLMGLFLTQFSMAQTAPTDSLDDMTYWDPLMDAIIEHESGGNPNARCGIYLGPMQIAPVLVRQCNILLKARKRPERFTQNDRRSIEKSKQMFVLIMSEYNRDRDIDKAIRIWAAGPHYSIKGTQKHVKSIRAIMERQQAAKAAKAQDSQK